MKHRIKRSSRTQTMAEGARLLLDGRTPAEIEAQLGLRQGTVARWMMRPDFDRLCADLSGATDIELQQQRQRLQEKAVAEIRRMMDSAHRPSVRFAVRTALEWLAERRAAYGNHTLPQKRRRGNST